MCIVIISFPNPDVLNFENNIAFLSSLFCRWPKKSGRKLKYLKNEQRLRRNEKHFSSFLKSFPWPEIVSDVEVHL